MNPPSPPPPRQGCGATVFQVVIALIVIAVLLAMLFPMVGPKPGTSARRAKAKQDALAIAHAVEQYLTEYQALPQPDLRFFGKDSPNDVAVGDPAAGMKMDNATLFNILRDIDRAPNAGHIQNPKRQVFFGAAAVSNPKKPMEGFHETAGSGGVQGAFYDPWGKQYNVVLDTNKDNLIDVKEFYSDFAGEEAPHVQVGVFALGKDLKLGIKGTRKYKDEAEKADDTLSWTSN